MPEKPGSRLPPTPSPVNGNQMAGCLVSAWGAARTGEMGWGPGFQNPSPGRGRVRARAPATVPLQGPTSGRVLPFLRQCLDLGKPYPPLASFSVLGRLGALSLPGSPGKLLVVSPAHLWPPLPKCCPSQSFSSPPAQDILCHPGPHRHTGGFILGSQGTCSCSLHRQSVSLVCVWHNPRFRP